MNRPEAATLLALCSAYDRRTVGDSDVMAWADALDDIRLADATEAVKGHYRNSREWLMPSDVRAAVRRLRDERIGNAAIPPEPDGWDWLDWTRHVRKVLGDGGTVEDAMRPEHLLKPRDMSAIESTFRRVPGGEVA
jgi:hypothetical protein